MSGAENRFKPRIGVEKSGKRAAKRWCPNRKRHVVDDAHNMHKLQIEVTIH
jgi:hypothetical protein